MKTSIFSTQSSRKTSVFHDSTEPQRTSNDKRDTEVIRTIIVKFKREMQEALDSEDDRNQHSLYRVS